MTVKVREIREIGVTCMNIVIVYVLSNIMFDNLF